LKEQNKYIEVPSVIFDELQRILPFANKVADEIIGETDLLEKIIPRMFEVMHKVARFSCNYVKRGKWSLFVLASADSPACQREQSVGWSTRKRSTK
jgi:hypothetical protein